jgi:phage repressor protein C with HTH and peptisase S24 domain
MKHSDVWRAIELFAADHNMSCSGLARKGGLDSTTFNRSKRWSSVGQERWPSMHSVAKILDCTGAKFTDFTKFLPK